MFFTTKLPNWVFIVTVVVAVIVIGIISWQATLILKDIYQIYSGIVELSGEIKRDIQKGPKIPADWKTYRNEEHGFEIDYPAEGWEFKEYLRLWMNEYRSGNFTLHRKYETGIQKDKEEFWIDVNLEFLYSSCYNCSWGEIFASNQICEGTFIEEEFLEREEECCRCLGGRIYGGEFQKEITSDFGVKGYQGKIKMPYAEGCIYEMIVYFPLKKEIKSGERSNLPLVALHYFDCPKHLDYGQEEIGVFNQMIPTFRFIEEKLTKLTIGIRNDLSFSFSDDAWQFKKENPVGFYLDDGQLTHKELEKCNAWLGSNGFGMCEDEEQDCESSIEEEERVILEISKGYITRWIWRIRIDETEFIMAHYKIYSTEREWPLIYVIDLFTNLSDQKQCLGDFVEVLESLEFIEE